MRYINMGEEWKLFTGWVVIVLLLLLSGCAPIIPSISEDNKKSTPQCCRGQAEHSCDMPGMTEKPIQKEAGR